MSPTFWKALAQPHGGSNSGDPWKNPRNWLAEETLYSILWSRIMIVSENGIVLQTLRKPLTLTLTVPADRCSRAIPSLPLTTVSKIWRGRQELKKPPGKYSKQNNPLKKDHADLPT